MLGSRLPFTWKNGRIYIKKFADATENKTRAPFVELQIAGRAHPSNVAAKAVRCSESESLRYVSHCIKGDALAVTQANERCEVTTRFRALEGIRAVTVGYPQTLKPDFTFTANALTVRFDGYTARFLEIATGK